MALDVKQFNFLSTLTSVVVLIFLGASVYALISGKISYEAFAASVGTPVGMLLGFWIKREE